MVRVSLLTESRLKENFSRHKKEDKEIDEVGFAVPEPMTQKVKPSAKVTAGSDIRLKSR